LASTNAFNQGILGPIGDMMMAGMNSQGAQGLNFDPAELAKLFA
jgi:hypothetical protein